jgi:hypothetical protein
MKKILVLLAILIALGVATFMLTKPKSIAFVDADIRVQKSADIHKLLLVDMNGNKAVLALKNNEWTLNDTLIGRVDAVNNILKILQTIQPTQPVSSGAHNAVIKELATTGTKVEAYDADGKVLTSFTIGSSIDNGKNNFILKKGCDRPYLYKDGGFIGDISISFFTSVAEWRDRRVFRYSADSVSKIWVCYADFADSNFIIDNTTNEYNMQYANGTPIQVSHTKVKDYIKEYTAKYCLNFENQMQNADSIKYKGKNYGFIAIATKNKQIDTLHLVRVKANQRVSSPRVIDGVIYDQESLFAYNKKDLMVLQTESFAKILATPSYFAQ